MDFDPSQFGATPVAEPFDPKKFGAQPVQPAFDPAKFDAKPHEPVQKGVSLGQGIGDAFADIPAEYQREQKAGAEKLGQDVKDFGKNLGKMEPTLMGIPKPVTDIAMDAASYLFSPLNAVTRSVVGRPVEKVTGSKKAGDIASDVVGAAIPFVGEVGPALKAREAMKAMEEAKAPVVKPEPSPVSIQGGLSKPTASPHAVQEPGPVLEMPKGPETTKQTAQRVDDALYRTQKSATADKIEAKNFLESLPKDVIDPALQERLYTEIEQKMVDPRATLSPEAQKAFDAIKPWKEEEGRLFKSIKEMGSAEMADIPEDGTPGYVHRVVKGKGTYFDRADPEATRSMDPVLGTRSLSKKASSLQPRQFHVIEGPDGKRVFMRDGTSEEIPEGYTKKPATSAEVEANTGVRYYKNAAVNTVDNVLRLRRVERNMKLLNDLKPQLMEKGLMMPRGSNTPVPDHFIKVTMPQFEGYYLDPKVANVLNDFHGELARGGDLNQVMSKVNRVLTGSLFFTPIPHMANVMNHWMVGRGFDWVRPGGYKSLAQDGAKAISDVWNLSPKYQQMLKEGNGLLYGDVANQNFYKLMMEKMGTEIVQDPQTWTGIAKNLGFRTPVDLVKQIYRSSSKMLWAANDVFMLQRVYELERKGLATREAIREAEKDIPNYRIPSEVMGSRAVSEVMRNPNAMMFGRYKYGQFKAYSNLVKDLVKGTGAEKKEAVGRLMVMGLLAFGAYPLVSSAARRVTGNKDAAAHRFGPFSIPEAVYEFTTGQKDWLSTVSTIMSPAPVIETMPEVLHNRDVFGREIVNPQSTPLGKGVQAGEYAAGKFSPAGQAMTAMKPGGAAQVAGRNLGIDLPSDSSLRGKMFGRKIDAKAARKRERKDEIEQAVKRVLGQ